MDWKKAVWQCGVILKKLDESPHKSSREFRDFAKGVATKVKSMQLWFKENKACTTKMSGALDRMEASIKKWRPSETSEDEDDGDEGELQDGYAGLDPRD